MREMGATPLHDGWWKQGQVTMRMESWEETSRDWESGVRGKMICVVCPQRKADLILEQLKNS